MAVYTEIYVLTACIKMQTIAKKLWESKNSSSNSLLMKIESFFPFFLSTECNMIYAFIKSDILLFNGIGITHMLYWRSCLLQFEENIFPIFGKYGWSRKLLTNGIYDFPFSFINGDIWGNLGHRVEFCYSSIPKWGIKINFFFVYKRNCW